MHCRIKYVWLYLVSNTFKGIDLPKCSKQYKYMNALSIFETMAYVRGTYKHMIWISRSYQTSYVCYIIYEN